MEGGRSRAQGPRPAGGELRQPRRLLLVREFELRDGALEVAEAEGQEEPGVGCPLRDVLTLQLLPRGTASPGAVARRRAMGTRRTERDVPANSLRAQDAGPRRFGFVTRTTSRRLNHFDVLPPCRTE